MILLCIFILLIAAECHKLEDDAIVIGKPDAEITYTLEHVLVNPFVNAKAKLDDCVNKEGVKFVDLDKSKRSKRLIIVGHGNSDGVVGVSPDKLVQYLNLYERVDVWSCAQERINYANVVISVVSGAKVKPSNIPKYMDVTMRGESAVATIKLKSEQKGSKDYNANLKSLVDSKIAERVDEVNHYLSKIWTTSRVINPVVSQGKVYLWATPKDEECDKLSYSSDCKRYRIDYNTKESPSDQMLIKDKACDMDRREDAFPCFAFDVANNYKVVLF